jgi:hypothetical protein
MVMTVAIPWLVGRTVDATPGHGPVGDPALAWRSSARILRLGLTVAPPDRGKAFGAVEFDLRERFYRHPAGARALVSSIQQTGQLMSGPRSTCSRFAFSATGWSF